MSIHIATKEEAWVDPPDIQFVPVDRKEHPFTFRRRWFLHRNCATFSTYLPKRLPPDKPHKVITIGVFEGMQEVWLMQNCLRHPESVLYAIDPWMETTKLDQQFMEECHANAAANLAPWRDQAVLIRGKSQDVLGRAVLDGRLFDPAGRVPAIRVGEADLVIIDGDHNADPVYVDACLACEMAARGGWLLFDDVRNQIPKRDHVYDGLLRFLEEAGDNVRQLWAHRFCDCLEKQ